MGEPKEFNYRLLMLTTLIISGCSIIYELLISSVSSYLLGDSIAQFSITIGLYMCAMGLGSYLSKFIKTNLFDCFIFVEIGVGVIGGISSMILFLANIYLESYQLVMYIEIIMIGTLVGLEIPLLTRIIEGNTQNLRVTLSSIFSFDYIGGLVGSIVFPLLLLPNLGYFSTAFLVGLCNLLISFLIIISYGSYIKFKNIWKITAGISLAVMLFGMLFSENIAHTVENNLYRDKVILSEQTKYQKIVATKHKDDLRLYINGNIQFSSSDEYRYHESLIHIPMSVAKSREKILVLGGGDGLALREILKYEDVETIKLVDLDAELVEICKTNPNIVKLNQNSFESSKLTVVNEDAYQFLTESEELFDVIIVDLPDPNDEGLNKLYTNLFYRLCGNRMNEAGVMAVQSTSPYYAKKAYWCINKTLESENFYVTPYHVQVPSFGDWGFQLASKSPIDTDTIELQVNTKFLNQENIPGIFLFAQDEIIDKDDIYANKISRPQLLTYYNEAEKNWN